MMHLTWMEVLGNWLLQTDSREAVLEMLLLLLLLLLALMTSLLIYGILIGSFALTSLMYSTPLHYDCTLIETSSVLSHSNARNSLFVKRSVF